MSIKYTNTDKTKIVTPASPIRTGSSLATGAFEGYKRFVNQHAAKIGEYPQVRYDGSRDMVQVFNPYLMCWKDYDGTGVGGIPSTITVTTTTLNGQAVTCTIGRYSYTTTFVDGVAVFSNIFDIGTAIVTSGEFCIQIEVTELSGSYSGVLEEVERTYIIKNGYAQSTLSPSYSKSYYSTRNGYLFYTRLGSDGTDTMTISSNPDFMVGKKIGIDGVLYEASIYVDGRTSGYVPIKADSNGNIEILSSLDSNSSTTGKGRTISFGSISEQISALSVNKIGFNFVYRTGKGYSALANFWIE